MDKSEKFGCFSSSATCAGCVPFRSEAHRSSFPSASFAAVEDRVDDCLQHFLSVESTIKQCFYGKCSLRSVVPFPGFPLWETLSYAPILSGMKGGRRSLNERKKQKIRPVWTPISRVLDNSTGGLLVTSTYAVMEYKSEAKIFIETIPV